MKQSIIIYTSMSEENPLSKHKNKEHQFTPKQSNAKIDRSKSKKKSEMKKDDSEAKTQIEPKTAEQPLVVHNKAVEKEEDKNEEKDRSGKKEALIDRQQTKMSQAMKSQEKNQKDAVLMKSATGNSIKQGNDEVGTNQKECGTVRGSSEIPSIHPKGVATSSKKSKLVETGGKKSKTAIKNEDKNNDFQLSTQKSKKVKSEYHNEDRIEEKVEENDEVKCKQKSEEKGYEPDGEETELEVTTKEGQSSKSKKEIILDNVEGKSNVKRSSPIDVIQEEQVKKSVQRNVATRSMKKDTKSALKDKAKSGLKSGVKSSLKSSKRVKLNAESQPE